MLIQLLKDEYVRKKIKKKILGDKVPSALSRSTRSFFVKTSGLELDNLPKTKITRSILNRVTLNFSIELIIYKHTSKLCKGMF